MDHIIGLCRHHGITVILVTHDAQIAARTDREVRIMDGRVESDRENRNAGKNRKSTHGGE